jgi:uncharacterized protein (TIGR02611 family)
MPSNESSPAPRDPPRRAGVSQSALRHVRRVAVAVIGATVLAIGIAMIVLPGPATVVIPLGLGILAAEFAWARRMLQRLKEGTRRALNGLT